MKKQLQICSIVIIILLLCLIGFLIWKLYSIHQETQPSPPQDMCDALILVDPQKTSQSTEYDLKYTQNSTPTKQYLSVGTQDTVSLSYHQNLTVHINRNLTLSDNDICQYGLFEKSNKQFAVFYSEISAIQNAERLCHLILCYRDYFPILLFGKFDSDTSALLTDICQLSSSSINDVTYYYQNLSVTSHPTSSSLLLTLQKTPRTLDLNKKMVALTFDDGPSAYTEKILESLALYQAKATFFVNGSHVTEYPKVIESIFQNHCEIGNHTNLHELFEQNTQGIIRKTIEETNKKVRQVIGIGTFVVRPPGGGPLDKYQNTVTIGYPIIRWSLDTFDYLGPQSTSSLLATIQPTVRHGDIILMHDTKVTTAEASESIISYLTSQGFQLVTVSELLEFSSDGAITDRIYNDTISNK